MNVKYLILIVSIIFFGCTEPENLSCPAGQIEDDCGVCCDETLNSECSNGPNTGVMDACGVCFGEIQNEADCIILYGGVCTDPEAGNYNQPAYNSECICNYNYSIVIGPNGIETIDNPTLEIDLKFLIEDFCQGEAGCNNFSNRQCCEDEIDPLYGCDEIHGLDCEWIATFTTKSCRPIYFTNTSNIDISIVTNNTQINECIGNCQNDSSQCNCEDYNGSACSSVVGCEWREFDDYNPLWNNFLEGESIPAFTIFDSVIYPEQDTCNEIDTQEGISCTDYDNESECNNNGYCNWYKSYPYILGNNTPNGAFQYPGIYKFCSESNIEKCGEIIVE